MVRERFELEPLIRWVLLVGPWFFGGMAILSAALPFMPDDGRPSDPTVTLVLSIVGAAGFGIATWLSLRVALRLPSCSVQIDNDGLWPAFRSKTAGLVRWRDITSVRERHLSQCLELLDKDGASLMRLEYQLRGFERLRGLVRERAALQPVVVLRRVFQKTFWYHLFSIAGILLFVALGLYLAQENPVFGYASAAGLGAILTWEYARTAYKVSVVPNGITIAWPGRSLTLTPAEVRAIELSDGFAEQSRFPRVTLSLQGSLRPVHLHRLGVSAFELHQLLSAWRSDVA